MGLLGIVSDCEGLVGVTHRGMMGVGFSVGLWFYSSVLQSYFDDISYYILLTSPSIPPSYFDIFSYYFLFFPPSVPQSYFDIFSYYILLSFPFLSFFR